MLVVKRSEGELIRVTEVETGHVLEFRLYNIRGGYQGRQGRSNLAFRDDARHFRIERIEQADLVTT